MTLADRYVLLEKLVALPKRLPSLESDVDATRLHKHLKPSISEENLDLCLLTCLLNWLVTDR